MSPVAHRGRRPRGRTRLRRSTRRRSRQRARPPPYRSRRRDPCCKQLIRDLERVSWKADSNDNLLPQLDKTNPGLTHVSDALGYLIESEFALRQMGGPKSTLLL